MTTLTSLSPEEVTHLRAYLASHWKTPEQYILDVFKTHDVVLLAEEHAIRHNLKLAHNMIPLLHQPVNFVFSISATAIIGPMRLSCAHRKMPGRFTIKVR